MRKFVIALQKRGVVLELVSGKLRCRGSLTADERNKVSANAQIIAAILNPDLTLPDEIYIPASVQNNVIEIEKYINSQRRKVAA